MLVLTRKLGEQIVIGDDIVVTVVAVGPGKIRLGIEAPPAVHIVRHELQPEAHGTSPQRPWPPKG